MSAIITLFEKDIIITKEMSKTNIIQNIEVDKDYEQLIFYCEYSPKAVTDETTCKMLVEEAIGRYLPEEDRPPYQNFMPINNLITLSIDDEKNNYLGCAHRGAPVQKHVISEKGSDKGFFSKKIKKGTYRAVINVHLVAFEDVTYNLKVVGVV